MLIYEIARISGHTEAIRLATKFAFDKPWTLERCVEHFVMINELVVQEQGWLGTSE